MTFLKKNDLFLWTFLVYNMVTMNSIYESIADKKDHLLINYYSHAYFFSHYHKSIEIIYCIRGKVRIRIDNNNYILEQDDICFIPSFTVHNFESVTEDNEIMGIVFSYDYFTDFLKDFPNKTLPYVMNNKEENAKCKDYLHDFFTIFWTKKDIMCHLKKQAFIDELLFRLACVYELEDANNGAITKRITDVLEYINQHYDEDISLVKLADKFGYNSQYLSRIFNNTLGENLTSYINNLRIEKVNAILSNNKENYSLNEIIEKCGFNSSATYYRVKKKSEGNKKAMDLAELCSSQINYSNK